MYGDQGFMCGDNPSLAARGSAVRLPPYTICKIPL